MNTDLGNKHKRKNKWDLPNVNPAQETDTHDTTNNKRKINTVNAHIQEKDKRKEVRNTNTHYVRARGSPNMKKANIKRNQKLKKKEQT